MPVRTPFVNKRAAYCQAALCFIYKARITIPIYVAFRTEIASIL